MCCDLISDDLGCSVNAISILDDACSGKQQCEYLVPQTELYNARCTQDLISELSLHLQAEYTCIQGIFKLSLFKLSCFVMDIFISHKSNAVSACVWKVLRSGPPPLWCSSRFCTWPCSVLGL